MIAVTRRLRQGVSIRASWLFLLIVCALLFLLSGPREALLRAPLAGTKAAGREGPANLEIVSHPETTIDPGWEVPANAHELALRGLPPALADVPEMIAYRTANSATFDLGDGQFQTVLSSGAIHYQEPTGVWQVIDPAFTMTEDSFMVERNSIRSRAGLDMAWLSAANGEAMIRWQARALGTAGRIGVFNEVARALPDGGLTAEQEEEGRVLVYRKGWTDSGVSERLVSAADSVEHLLVLEQLPEIWPRPQTIVLQADLQLLPGATLWAGGKAVEGSLETTGALEVRDSAGQVAIVLDPVLAFELETPEQSVGGHYRLRPGAQEGRWIVELHTPWEWWADPNRTYPAAIDPIMHVTRTSGGGGLGMAWVGNGGDAPNQNYQLGGVVLGRMLSDPYYGFMQFNTMPAFLTHPLAQISSAELRVTPSYYHIPSYKHDSDDGPDYEAISISHDATVWHVNLQSLCPDPLADPTCWSLVDGRLGSQTESHNWSTKPGQNAGEIDQVEKKTLTVGPANKQGKGKTTIYDVTPWIRDWYDISPRPNHGPAFMISHNNSQCVVNAPAPAPAPPPYQIEDWPQQVPRCTRFWLGPDAEHVQLHLIYQALPLQPGDHPLNRPGVPSFKEPILNYTEHQYYLSPHNVQRWRAVAVRGNHGLTQTLPAKADLRLLDATAGENDASVLIESTLSNQKDQTSFVLINDHACSSSGICGGGVDLRADALPSDQNNYEQDQARNYRIQYEVAQQVSVGYSNTETVNVNVGSDELIHMLEFDLEKWDTLAVMVESPDAIEAGLAMPTNDGDKVDTVVGSNLVDTGFTYVGDVGAYKAYSLEATNIERAGKWLITLANQEPPVPDPENASLAQDYNFTVEILRCPFGTIPTIKWECQPVPMPDGSTPSTSVTVGAGVTEVTLDIYSEGGFTVGNNPDPNESWCTTNEGVGTPLVGPPVDNRWLVVGNGSLCWDALNGFLTTMPDSGVGLTVPHPLDPNFGFVAPSFLYGSTFLPLPIPLGVKHGITGFSEATGLQWQPTPDTKIKIDPYREYWLDGISDKSNYIDLATMKLTGGGTLAGGVSVDAASDPVSITWDVPWTVYPGSASSYVFDPQPQQSAPFHAGGSFLDLASLELRIGGSGTGDIEGQDYYKLPTQPIAWQLREADAQITQDPAMGGATKLVQATVLPPGVQRLPAGASGAKSCTWPGNPSKSSSCLDVRYDGYTWNSQEGDKAVPMWELPDIHLDDDLGTMIVSGPDGVQIFSDDHPDSPLAPAVSQSFSFDTWNATVSIDIDKCFETDTEEVTVIRGEALIGLPTVGETSVPPSVQIGFKLCETKLAEASLTLEIPKPGVPVGSSGAGVSLIGGKVTIGPESVQIQIDVEFQTMDQSTITNGYGTVLIDTAGLFQLEVGAKIVQALDAKIKLQIAWQPLDVLIQAQITCCGGLIGGELYMHMWMGQGFQNKYPHLPDNDDMHFTGYIKAWLTLEEDYVAPWIPPFDITITLTISFGEFCKNETCTQYAWGMSAVLTVAGFDVGLYVDEDGADFIFGSDDHVLIDQFGQSGSAPVTLAPQAAEAIVDPVTPGELQPQLTWPAHSSADDWPVEAPGNHCSGPANGPTLVCSFEVGPGAGRAFFSTTWQNGDLQVTLQAPDSTVISYTNALSYGVTISETSAGLVQQANYAVRPLAGQQTVPAGFWTLTLDNVDVGLAPGLHSNYRIMWFTDPPPPAVTWFSPVVSGTVPNGNNEVALSWSATRAGAPLGSGVEMELIYTPVYSKPEDLELFNGTLITSRLPANSGSYTWDVSHLASGEYAVGARLDDRFQANGHVASWAPGTVVVNDTTPPPAPHVLTLKPIHDALVVKWETPDVPDLSGYLIEYTYPQPDGSSRWTARRITARGEWTLYLNDKPFITVEGVERVRLGRLLDNFTTMVCLRAYDNSGNVGPCEEHTVLIPRQPPDPLSPPQNLLVEPEESRFLLNWDPPAEGGPVAGYYLGFAPAGCVLPGAATVAEEGAPLLDVGNVTSSYISNLTPDQFYDIGVAAYDALGITGPMAGTVARMTSRDGDADGLPDVWADAWGVAGAGEDPDQDGVDNGGEYDQGSNPLHADSDLDGIYDGEEVANGTDLCSTAETPPFSSQPKLTLFGSSQPSFLVAANQTAIFSQTIKVFNLGGGEMDWNWSSPAPWLQGQKVGDELLLSVDPSLLAPGTHTTTVQINSSPLDGVLQAGATGVATVTVAETYTLPVSVAVLREQAFNPAVAPDLAFDMPLDPDDVGLRWGGAVANAFYTVYGASDPGFSPGPATELATVNNTAYTDQAALFGGAQARYYLVRAHGYEGDTALSQRAGAFEFTLVPGQ